MTVYSIGISLSSLGFLPGQARSTTPTLSLTTLNNELRGLTTNDARRALILRLFSASGNANLPGNLSGYNRNTLTAVFHGLRGILENRDINIDNATRARGFRFLSGFAERISGYIRSADGLDESILMFDQYRESYEGLANALEAVSQISTIARDRNALRLTPGIFHSFPYSSPPDGVAVSAETLRARRLVRSALVNAVNAVPQSVEIISPAVTDDNHENIEKDFEMLENLITEMRTGILLPNERRAFARLVLLGATYADELSRYHRQNENNELKEKYEQLATDYVNLLQQIQRRERDAAPYTGPELNDPAHKLTFLWNRVRTLQTQLQSARTEQARNNLKRTLIMELFGDAAPNCPGVADFYHRGTSTAVFYALLEIAENPDIDIPPLVRARALKFLSTYAVNFAEYIDRQNIPEDRRTTVRFCALNALLESCANTLEALEQVSGQISTTTGYTIRLPVGALLGIPYQFSGLEDTDPGSTVESFRMKKIIETKLVQVINSAWDRGKILAAPNINNERDLEKVINEFNYLRRLAISISVRDNNSPETLKALPHIWGLCSKYAISIMDYYYRNRNRAQMQQYGQFSIDCTIEAHLSRVLPAQPLSSSALNRLEPTNITPNLVTIDIMLQRATTPQTKRDFIRRLFEGQHFILTPPSNFSGLPADYIQRIFTGIKNMLDDPDLNIDINTRIRGFKFLSNYAKNYAQSFPADSDNRRIFSAYATTYESVANTLEAFAGLPQRASQPASGGTHYIRLSVGNLEGIPFHGLNLPSSHMLNTIENSQLRRLVISQLVRNLNATMRPLDAPQINNSNYRQVINEFYALHSLATYLDLRRNSTSNPLDNETLKALSTMWSLCNRYASALEQYYENAASNTNDGLYRSILLQARDNYRAMAGQATINSSQVSGVLIARLISSPMVQVAQNPPPVTIPPPVRTSPPIRTLPPVIALPPVITLPPVTTPPPAANPIPQGNVGNVEITLQNGHEVELTNYASGPPSEAQRNTYQRVIRFTFTELIPSQNFIHTGTAVQRTQNSNQNISTINIPNVCHIYTRRNNDGTYTYLIGVYNDFDGRISIGNRVAFNNRD